MATDENENDRDASPPSPTSDPAGRAGPASEVSSSDSRSTSRVGPRLEPRVERALENARAGALRASATVGAPNGGRWLALIPVSMALLAMGLMMPRAAPPEDVPLPKLDARVLDAARAIDTSRAVSARRDRLPSQVLLVGTTLRALNTASARNASDDDVGVRRTAVDQAVRALLSDGETAFEQLATLRALQLEAFLAEVEAFEATGQASAELDALGGGFVDRMRAAGWLDGQRVLLDENERRVAFKLVWSAQLGVERVKPLALSIDEQRVLYALYIRRPHVPEAQRASYVSLRSAANTDEACKRAVAEEAVATDQWRIEKVKRLGELDAEYPTAFALGVLYYRVGRFDAATEAFRSWLEKHPDGPYTLRARNHIKAAHLAGGPS